MLSGKEEYDKVRLNGGIITSLDCYRHIFATVNELSSIEFWFWYFPTNSMINIQSQFHSIRETVYFDKFKPELLTIRRWWYLQLVSHIPGWVCHCLHLLLYTKSLSLSLYLSILSNISKVIIVNNIITIFWYIKILKN